MAKTMKSERDLRAKRKKEGFWRYNYRLSWGYLKESQNFIYIVFGVFMLCFLIGFLIPAPDFVVEKILEFIKELIEKTEGMGTLEMIQFIFLNNLKTSFFGLVFGVFFGVFPVLAAMANGYVLGFVTLIVVGSEGVFILWRLFPHGIFELPAVFISLGLGLRFGTFIFTKNKAENFRYYFLNSLRVFLFIIIPLLIIAAIIEGVLVSVFE